VDRPPGGIGAEGSRTLLVPVYFDFDKSIIKPAEVAKLQAAVKYLGEHPDQRLLLEGHCDWRGTAEYNLSLGDRRAAAVKQYLEKLKVPTEKLDTLSKGSIGAAEKGTEEQMGKDRRVELVVMMVGAANPPADLQAPPAAP
jgi:peptidoglycan-associated lipoprotein